jgi:beta-N-acetylhexosaminidase
VNAQSLADRVGSLVIVGFDGRAVSQAPLDLIEAAAGAALFSRNLESAEQAAELVGRLQDAARAAGALPLIIGIDEEGGTVSRLAGFGTTMPSAMAMGATGDSNLTMRAYGVIGEELAALGVTVDFAPVADLNSNPANPVIGVRSFGDDPASVSNHVRAAIAGLHASGVAAAAKHFPGHGDASVDSHGALPTLAHDAARLSAVEFAPFRAAIEAGVDAIMTAHVSLPSVDPSGVPATLSRPILTGLLREELRFTGVIVTDCMQMEAIAGRYGAGDAAVMAVDAGADLVTFSSSIDSAREAIAALRHAVASGSLDAARVEQSLLRVSALRAGRQTTRRFDRGAVGGDAHRQTALAVARKSVTLVRDPLSTLPLRLVSGQKIFLVQFEGGAATPAESSGKQTTRFGKMLARGPARVQEQIRSLDPTGHEYKQLLMAAASADVVIAVTRRAWAHRLQALAVADLALAGKPLIVIAAREPYDATAAPADAAVIATYGDDEAAMEAAVEVLLGTHRAQGRLPVALPGESTVTTSSAAP